MRRGLSRRRALPLLLLWCAVFHGMGRSAELDIHEVKARYIYNFVRYITWPQGAPEGGVFEIAVMDSPGLKMALDGVLRGKEWQGKPLHSTLADSSAAGAKAQVVYVRETNRDRVTETLRGLPKAALTVGEGPNFLPKGGMIEFNLSEGKVHFSVNLKALREAGFAVDSKLLTAAAEVVK